MSRKLKTWIIVLVIIFTVGVIGIYLSIQSMPGFWTSEGIIEKKLSHQVMITKFHIDNEAEHPHSMNLIMTGQIDGTGRLMFGWSDSKFYKMDTISKDFRIDYNADWYSDTCFVTFEPIEMTKGNLKIDYKIFSSKK